jgi:heptosyltransferase-2
METAPKKILVRAPNWIGDQILAYPFFHFLRKAHPTAHITVACPHWVQAVQFKNLVDQVVVLPRSRNASILSRFDSLEKGAEILRRMGPWDLGIALPNSFSSAWLIYRAGARVRVGYSTEVRGFLLTQRLKWEKPSIKSLPGAPSCSHRSEAYLGLLKSGHNSKGNLNSKFGKDFWGIPSLNDLDPRVPGVVSEFDAEKAWPDAEPLEPPSVPYWVLAPGSTAESRRWPPSYFADLARKIAVEKDWVGIVVGGIAESDIAAEWESTPGLKLQDWTAKGTPASYWKVFKNAKLSVCNDSGLAHVASLCGSLVQVVWGAGNPLITEPMGPGRVQISMNPVDCWPCESNTCKLAVGKKLECLKGIYADAVWNEIKAGFRI